MGWRRIWETLRRYDGAFELGVAFADGRCVGCEGYVEPSQGWVKVRGVGAWWCRSF
jgi:hypothetical protein